MKPNARRPGPRKPTSRPSLLDRVNGRVAYQIGKPKAITATARKLAIVVYRTLKDGLRYQDPGAAAYDTQHRLRVLRHLRHRAATLGFSLVNRETGELLEGRVS